MKKILTLLIVFILLSCNKDSDNNELCFSYTAMLETVCGDQSTRVTYEISEGEFDRLSSLPFTGDPCNWVSVRDIKGGSHGGYLRASSGGSHQCN